MKKSNFYLLFRSSLRSPALPPTIPNRQTVVQQKPRQSISYFLSILASPASAGRRATPGHTPACPNDEPSVRVTAMNTKSFSSRPDRGVVRALIETENQNREMAMSLTTADLFCGRERAGESTAIVLPLGRTTRWYLSENPGIRIRLARSALSTWLSVEHSEYCRLKLATDS